MFKILYLIFGLFFSFVFASDFEIPIDKAKEVTINKLKKEIQNDNQKQETKIVQKKDIDNLFKKTSKSDSLLSPLTQANDKYINSKKIKLKNYVGVSYNKKLEWFSILGHDRVTFERIKNKYHIYPSMERKYLNFGKKFILRQINLNL